MPKVTAFEPAMRRALEGVVPRARILARCGSTNDEARAWAREGAPDGALVVANAQEAGRGRRGRAWIAAPGEALTASWVIRPELEVARWGVLPLLAGLAVAEAIQDRTGVIPNLKWPNDLFARNRKLAGLLLEAEPTSFAVIGVGVNVATTSFPEGIVATSLALEGALRLDRADLAAAISLHLRGVLEDPDAGLERYRARSSTLGSRVRVEQDAEIFEGEAVAITHEGALLLALDDRTERLVRAGDVVHLRAI